MRVSPVLAAGVLLLAGSFSAAAEKKQLDPEFLEFLGTYQTSGGKSVDPLMLEDEKPVARQKKEKDRKKPVGKSTIQTEKDRRHE